MKIKLLFLFVISFNAIMISQTDLVWSDEIISDFNFSHSPNDFPKVFVENNIIKALSLSDTDNDNKLQLVEYSLDGEILNTKYYGIAPSEDDRVGDYKFDANGNLYLLKRINLNFDDTSLVLQKYDPDANIIWEQQLVTGQNIQYGGTNIELLNENQIFIGVQEYNMSNGDENLFVLSYNINGTFLWQVDMPEIEFFTSEIKSYDNNVIFFGFNSYPFHSMITIEPDGTKTVVGNIEFIRGLNDIFVDENLGIFATHGSLYWLSKLNSLGQVIWSTLYDDQILGLGLERINAFIKDDQGNIFVTGHVPGDDSANSTDIYLDFLTLKLSSDGEILWENRYHRSIDSGEQAYDLALKNGFIYVCGESSNDGIGTLHDFVVIKMNALNGEETTQYRYDNNGFEDCFYSMEVLDTNEIILTGFSSEEFGSKVNLITQKLSGVTGTLSISEIKRDNLLLSPNPINSNGTLKIRNNYFSKYSILTINGVEVQSGHIEIGNYSEIHLDNYSGGLYLLVLKSDTETITKKLVIK